MFVQVHATESIPRPATRFGNLGEGEKHAYLKQLQSEEVESLTELNEEWEPTAQHVSTLFVRIFEKLVRRFAGVLDPRDSNPHLFELQMKGLTADPDVCFSIIDQLCIQEHVEHIALMSIAADVGAKPID